jgi:large repetitive protein
MTNIRRNLAVQIVPAGGTNPLKMRLAGGVKFTIGVAASTAALIAQGGAPAYAYSIVGGALPTGLSVNSSMGVISGTPSVAGTATFTAQVQDSASTVFQATFTINVAHLLVGVAVTPPTGENSVPYSYKFAISGAIGAVTWAVTAGAIPSSFTLSSAGVLSGTQVATATYSFTVTATDAGSGDTLSISVTLTLVAGFSTSIADPSETFTNGISGIVTFNTTGGAPPFALGALANVPAGVLHTFAPLNGSIVFYGAPNYVGSVVGAVAFIVTGTRTDSLGGTEALSLGLVVNVPQPIIQPQAAGANVGTKGPKNLNFTGIGAAAVANDGTTATITLGANMNAPPSGATIPANSSATVLRKLTIPAGQKVTIGAGAILRIL